MLLQKSKIGLAFLPDSFLGSRREMIVNLAARQNCPQSIHRMRSSEAAASSVTGSTVVDLFRR
jgi:hypothetical protein